MIVSESTLLVLSGMVAIGYILGVLSCTAIIVFDHIKGDDE